MQDARAALQQQANVICQQRAMEQLALHCSPSLSLSQPGGTPVGGASTCGTAANVATGGTARAPAFNPEQPWQQLFLHRSASNAAPTSARARRGHNPCGGSARGYRQRSAFGTAAGIGTPPSVEPKLHQGGAAERVYSMGSLRRGALSFSSAGQPSGSINLDGAASDLSFLPDVSAELAVDAGERTGSIDGGRSAGLSQTLADRRRISVFVPSHAALQRQLNRLPSSRAETPRCGTPRSIFDSRCNTPHSVLGSSAPASRAHGTAAQGAASAAAATVRQSAQHAAVQQVPAESSVAQRCRVLLGAPPMQASETPFISDQAGVLDRFWLSQDEDPPSAADAGSARQVRQDASSPANGIVSLPAAEASVAMPAAQVHSTVQVRAAAAAKASGKAAAKAWHKERHAPVQTGGAPKAGASERGKAAAEPAHCAAGASSAALGAAATARRTKGNDMVVQCLGGKQTSAEQDSKEADDSAQERDSGGKATAGGNAQSKGPAQDADSLAMPAPPPVRRSRGTRLAGLASTQDGGHQENAGPGADSAVPALVSKPVWGSRMGAKARMPKSETVRHLQQRSATHAALQARGTKAVHGSRKLARQVAADVTNLPVAGRPELNAILPVCRTVAGGGHVRHH